MNQYGIFPILLALLCLTACGGRSPQPQYYLLGEELPAVAPLPGVRPAVVLRQVVLPPYLDREALVLRASGSVQILIAEYHLWAEPLNKAAPRLLEETMRPLLQEQGLNLLWPDAADAPLHVDVVILRLDGIPNGVAGISARWRILNREEILLAQGLFFRETETGGDYEALARVYGRLLADFGHELASAVGGASEQLETQSRNNADGTGKRH